MRQITKYVFLFAAIVLGVYDAYCYAAYGTTATLSSIFADNGAAHPILPFSFGVLMGHFFWPSKPDSFDYKVYEFICGWPLIALYIGFAMSYTIGWPPMITLLIGIPVGHFVFVQKVSEP